MTRRQIYTRLVVHVLFYLAICLCCIFVLPKAAVFFLPFIFGWLIAMIANPLVHFLEQHIKIVRRHGSVLVIVGVIAIIGAAIYGLGVVAVHEISSLMEDLPKFYEEFLVRLALLSEQLQGMLKNIPLLSKNAGNLMEDLPEKLTDFMDMSDMPMVSTATHAFHSVADGLLAVIMTFLSAYFFIVERDSILQAMSRRMPPFIKKHMDMIANSFIRAVGGYFKAQLKLAVIVFVILYIGFKVIGVKYACLLGIVVAFLDLLPVFGTGFVIWPWALFDVVTGEYMEMAGLLVIYILCQLIKQLLQPKMVGDSIGMKPLPTLIFLYCGYKIGGFIGMLIGIPVGMVIVNFYQAGAFDVLKEDLRNVSKDLLENYWESGE